MRKKKEASNSKMSDEQVIKQEIEKSSKITESQDTNGSSASKSSPRSAKAMQCNSLHLLGSMYDDDSEDE